MTAFPLSLQRVSRGFVALAPRLRIDGARLVPAIADALSAALRTTVSIEAMVAAMVPEPVLGSARVGVVFPSAGEQAVLEVDTKLLATVLHHVAGRRAATWPAIAASESDTSLLAFCALVAVDAARSCGLEPFGPLVSLGPAPGSVPAGHLAIQLQLRVGDHRSWGRVLLSAPIVAALGEPAPCAHPVPALSLPASLRDATTTLLPEELAALAPGDVLLLDPPRGHADLVLPGGLTFRGRLEGDLHVEEIRMTEPQSSYPIVLSIEIARVRVTLGDLARLAPGVALPLDVRKDGAVVLRAGEDVIARGTLVDVEGTLGVRIAQIGPLP